MVAPVAPMISSCAESSRAKEVQSQASPVQRDAIVAATSQASPTNTNASSGRTITAMNDNSAVTALATPSTRAERYVRSKKPSRISCSGVYERKRNPWSSGDISPLAKKVKMKHAGRVEVSQESSPSDQRRLLASFTITPSKLFAVLESDRASRHSESTRIEDTSNEAFTDYDKDEPEATTAIDSNSGPKALIRIPSWSTSITGSTPQSTEARDIDLARELSYTQASSSTERPDQSSARRQLKSPQSKRQAGPSTLSVKAHATLGPRKSSSNPTQYFMTASPRHGFANVDKSIFDLLASPIEEPVCLTDDSDTRSRSGPSHSRHTYASRPNRSSKEALDPISSFAEYRHPESTRRISSLVNEYTVACANEVVTPLTSGQVDEASSRSITLPHAKSLDLTVSRQMAIISRNLRAHSRQIEEL